MGQTPRHRIPENKQTHEKHKISSNIRKMERSQRPSRGRGRRRSRRCPALARCPCRAPSSPQKPNPAHSEWHVHLYDPRRRGIVYLKTNKHTKSTKQVQTFAKWRDLSDRPEVAGGGGAVGAPPSHAVVVRRRPRRRNRTLHLLNRTSILTILVNLAPG